MSPIREEHTTSFRRGVIAFGTVFVVSMLWAIKGNGLDIAWANELAGAAIEGIGATGIFAVFGIRDARRNDAKVGP